MNSELLTALVKRRRSIRTFSPEPLGAELLRELVADACHAPSNNNRQGWFFYALNDRPSIDLLAAAVAQQLTDRQAGLPASLAELASEYRANFTCFRSAPALLICCHRKGAGVARQLVTPTSEARHASQAELISVALVMQNILLLAESRGVGSVLMTAPLIASAAIRELVAIPARYEIAALIALGYYRERPPAPPHKTIDDVFALHRCVKEKNL